MIKNFIALFETIILFLFSYIIPKNKNLLIFGSRKGELLIGNPKFFYLYLEKKYNKKYTLLFYDKNNINKDSRIKTFKNSFSKYCIILRAQYLFIDNFSFDLGHSGVFVGNFNLVQTWHGEPIKGVGFLSDKYVSRRSRIVLFFEKLEYKTYKYVLSNPNTTKIFSGIFNNSKNVIGVGLPRNDLLLHKNILNLVKNNIVENKINNWKKEFKKVILLAPTFRETDSSDYFFIEEADKLNNILEKNNYLVIIKTHPNEVRKFLNKKYSNLINITKTLNFDATDFTPFVDIVMTDYSSIYIDFLLTGKPVIFYQKDLDNYINKERGLLYKPEEVVISETTAYNFDELLRVFNNLDKNTKTEKYKIGYKNLYNLFFKGLDKDISSCEKLDNLLLK